MSSEVSTPRKVRIVTDRNIPYIREVLSALPPLCEVTYLPGDGVTPQVMTDTDILLTRTRTRCDERLLRDSRCSFIATATIGTDHIDLDYCRSRGIEVANAPGCNAPAVAQYLLSAIKSICNLKGKSIEGKGWADLTLGIIGVGNVGSILARWAKGLGMKVLLNDPPKCLLNPDLEGYCDLEEIAREADIITLHTPLIRSGQFPTYHLIDKAFLDSTLRKPVIVNAARGPVVDTEALKEALKKGKVSEAVIDCWEGEPDIDSQLLSMAAIATPHIAGYSREGKIRATRMVVEALAGHLSKMKGLEEVTPEKLLALLPTTPEIPVTITEEMLDYDILADTTALKSSLPASDSTIQSTEVSVHAIDGGAAAPSQSISQTFESLRNNYNLRHEPSTINTVPASGSSSTVQIQ